MATAKKKTKPAAKAAAPKKATAKKATTACPTSTEVAAFLGAKITPRLKTQQIQRLRKALPGYANQLDDVADLLEGDRTELAVKGVTPNDLLDVQARYKALSAREAVLEAAYRSVYEQRLQVDDEAMGMLNAVAKRVQQVGEDDGEILVRWRSVLSFLGTFRTGGRPAKTASPGPTDPTPTA